MRFRNTLVLAALFLAFAGYLYFVEQPSHQASEAEKKLLQFKPEDVSEVTLTYPNHQIVVKKTAAGGPMKKPMAAAADNWRSTTCCVPRRIPRSSVPST